MKKEIKNKMAEVDVKKLMLSMGIPMIVSMVLQALYNIVDSAFVSNMPENGEAALNALTIAFPMQMLIVAFSIGTGVGVNALVAKSLGQGNSNKADKAAGNGLFLALIIYIAFLLFGLFGTSFYVKTQSTNDMICEMAIKYLKICCVNSVGIVFFSIFEKLLQATGNSLYSTIAQISGAVVNIILDPIMIYGLAGFPKLGITGAAVATVIGQHVSLIVALIFHLKFNNSISIKFSDIKPQKKMIAEIYAIGLPAIISQALMSLMTYCLNVICYRIGENMVTAYGLFYKIQQFILFAAFGIRDAITPIVSFGYGMKSKKRVHDGIKYGLIYTSVIMLTGTLIVEIFASRLASVFGLSGQTEQLCISAMRIISISFFFSGISIALQGVFQAIDSGRESLIVSVCRQFLFVIPVAYLFSEIVLRKNCDSYIVWLTFPIAEIITSLIAVFLIKKSKKIDKLAENI
ncbi:MAG: MATE family efflux transporter [Faecalibacterium sp.]|nr:MATE family efflux transporter [Ruminococcus sp.]MCM1392306.1 MATE family efflux transporter [Ruminococcus sp.]MCM1484718.1 MATE family efflux transporter [Faecalibacterium sp.]